jgi:hypothetical protein
MLSFILDFFLLFEAAHLLKRFRIFPLTYAARVRLITGFSDPSIIRLSVYDSCGSDHVELSSRNTAFPVYISQTEHFTQGARSSRHDHSLRVSPITHFGFGVKAQL